jgi:hypothetical protein
MAPKRKPEAPPLPAPGKKARAGKEEAAGEAAPPLRAGPGKKARAGKEEAPAPEAFAGKDSPAGKGPAAPAPAGATGAAGVHVTSSKACQAFGKHVDKLKTALGKLRPGVAIEVDTQPKEGKNPDRGSFVVAVNGKTVIELRAMPRPFTAMKGLDMDEVARKVVAAL